MRKNDYSNNKNILFSMIVSVYNVEPFMREALDSIIRQDIGFQKHIQIVLVDDGSTDGSGRICDEYQSEYPQNILVIHKENGGLSSARNEGMKHAIGKYINFVDPDDKLSVHTASAVYAFFQEHTDVGIASIPMYFFDGATGSHPTNYGKYLKNGMARVINLEENFELLQTSCASCFIKRELLQDIVFDERLCSMEDAKFLIQVFLNTPCYGAVGNCMYEYRKRSTGESSLSQGASKQKRWYLQHLELFSEEVIKIAISTKGYLPKFVQYVVMYDLQWKFKQKQLPFVLFKPGEMEAYKKKLFELLQFMDDDVILKQRSLYSEHFAYIFSKKYPDKFKIAQFNNDSYYLTNDKILFRQSVSGISLDFLYIQNQQLFIDGHFTDIMIGKHTNLNHYRFYVDINGNNLFCPLSEIRQSQLINEPIIKTLTFHTVIPLNKPQYTISFHVWKNDCLINKNIITPLSFCAVGNRYRHSYFYQNEYMLKCKRNNIQVFHTPKLRAFGEECAFLLELLCSKKASDKKAFCVRVFQHIFASFPHKPLWLLSDKPSRADDNGEALFRYINAHHSHDVHSFFVISKNSPDYVRLKKIGHVVPTLSWRHKILFTFASKTISAHSHIDVTNPFRKFYEPFRDYLFQCKFVFLQHGITHNNVTEGLNKYNKNISLFITCAKPEDQYIRSAPFYYDDANISLCGFPRYDRLYSDPQRIVTISPTWRSYLFHGFIVEESRRMLNDDFEKSEYYQFYNALINDEALLTAADKYKYKIQFFPHSLFFPYMNRFQADPRVLLRGTESSYREVFAQSDLLVTDYSSVAFDFAYLRKPVFYTQFDHHLFFSSANSYKPGYFDYERNGFGEVEYHLQDTIDRIIEYMRSGCILKEKYRQRIEDFFTFNDKNNCQRVYERILQMEKVPEGAKNETI